MDLPAATAKRYNLSYIANEWRTLHERGRYLNTRNYDIALAGKSRKEQDQNGAGRLRLRSDFERMLYTPRATRPYWDWPSRPSRNTASGTTRFPTC